MTAGAQNEDSAKKPAGSFFRGENTNLYPGSGAFGRKDVIDRYMVKGWMPDAPFVDPSTPIVAFGSCFAANISKYLVSRGFNVISKNEGKSYVTTMGDGLVNSFAIRQQFEWAWLNKTPEGDLWHGYSAEQFGYDEEIRLETKAMFDAADVFIITLGLSEIWYDEPTGEVFWRAVPKAKYDPSRHKFRVSTVEENRANLLEIHRLIRQFRPDASIVVTLSPIPLAATFRAESCLAANAVSKSVLRVAIDEVYRALHPTDPKLFYFPSFEIVMYLFNNGWQADRRHVRLDVLDFNMKVFERYFTTAGMSDDTLLQAFRRCRAIDLALGQEIAERAAADGEEIDDAVAAEARRIAHAQTPEAIEARQAARQEAMTKRREEMRAQRIAARKAERQAARVAGAVTAKS